MFRYSLFLDTLLKAMTHKYIRRVPKGVTKTGATKYMYYYAGQEGHSKGIAHESELVEGSAFAFGEHGKTRYHAHISKVDGDKITVKYDDGAKKDTSETMTKKQFQAMIHKEHATGIREAQVKSEKQLKDFQAGKEKGVKVKQSTLDRLAQRVANLKDLVSHIDQPAPIDAPWMSERERRLFEGQNRLFEMLKRRQITEALLKDHTNVMITWDMLQNVTTAIFKYKDLSQIPQKDIITLLTANRLAYKEGARKTQSSIFSTINALSDLWIKLPYAPKEKNTQVGRIDVIHADLVKQTAAQKKKRSIHIEAVKQAQEAMIKTDPDLAKIIYGNMVFTQITQQEGIGRDSQGFYSTGTPSHAIHNVSTTLETIYHSADVIYLDTVDHFDRSDADSKLYAAIPKDTITDFQTRYHKYVIIHELAHRFSKSLIEQGNTSFRQDITEFFSKYASKNRDADTLLNKPLKEFTIFDKNSLNVLSLIVNSPDARQNATSFFTPFVQKNGSYDLRNVDISEIDFASLGDSIITHSNAEENASELQVPLRNGDFMLLSVRGTIKKIQEKFNNKASLLPTTYAHENVEECFSEMMAAVCDPNYKDEPMRTEFLSILKKHKDSFGA